MSSGVDMGEVLGVRPTRPLFQVSGDPALSGGTLLVSWYTGCRREKTENAWKMSASVLCLSDHSY